MQDSDTWLPVGLEKIGKTNELVFKLFVRAYNWVIKRRSMDRGAGKWGLEAGGWILEEKGGEGKNQI